MLKKATFRLILLWVLCFLALIAGASFFFYQGLKNFAYDQADLQLDQSQDLIGRFIENEKKSIKAKLHQIAKNRRLTDFTDYGQVDMLKIEMESLLSQDKDIVYQIFDYEGDPLTTSDIFRKLDTKQLALNSSLKESHFEIQILTLNNSIYIAGFGPIGDEKSPSGILLIMRALENKLIESLNAFNGLKIGFVYQGTTFIGNQDQESMNDFLKRIPRRGSSLIDQPMEEVSKTKISRLLGVNDHLLTSDLRIILSYPLTNFEALNKNFVFPFILLSLLLLLCGLALTLWLLIPLGRAFQDIQTQLASWTSNVFSSVRLSSQLEYKTQYFSQKINKLIDAFQDKMDQLKKEEKKSQDKLTRIYNLISVDDVSFKMFIANVKNQGEDCKTQLKTLQSSTLTGNTPTSTDSSTILWRDIVADILRLIHTIHGDAKLFGLAQIENKAQEFEDWLMKIHQAEEAPSLTMLEEMENNLQVITSEINDYEVLRKNVLKRDVDKVIISEVTNTQILWLSTLMGRLLNAFRNPFMRPKDMNGLLAELEHSLSSVGRVDLRSFIKRYDDMLISLSEHSSKKINPIKITGDFPYVPIALIHSVHNVLVPIFKNALEHGIENMIKRVKLKKPEEGVISIDMQRKGEFLEIIIKDDGKGISLDDIKEVALHKKLVTPEDLAKMNDDECQNLIFKEGFSTSKVTLYEGRGMGLASVRHWAEELEGRVELISTAGVGTVVKVTLPVPSPRFINSHTLFHALTHLQWIESELKDEVQKCGAQLRIKNNLLSSSKEGLLFTNRMVFQRSIKNFIRLVASIAPPGLEIEIELKKITLSDVSDSIISIGFHFISELKSTFILNIFQNTKFQELLEQLSDEGGGFNFRVDPIGQSINFDILSHLPQSLTIKKLQIFLLFEDYDSVKKHINLYLEKTLGGWTFECITLKQLESISTQQVDPDHNICCVLIEDKLIPTHKIINDLFLNPNLHNLLILSHDVSSMDSALVGQAGIEPSVVELPLDHFVLEEAIENAIVQSIFS